MADMYSIVKKQDEKIDGLLKIANENKDLLMDIDTRLASEPAQATQPVSGVPEKIQVELPANIATKENVLGVVNQALKNQTDYTARVITKLCTDVLPKQSVSQPSSPAVSEEQIAKVAEAAANKAVAKRYEKLDAMADTVTHRIYNLVNGAVWVAIPKWAYIIFAIAVVAAGGFGYGFFYQLNENSRLKDVEWLYRYQRTAYKTEKSRQYIMNVEKDFITGTWQERDSIKNNIRYWERKADLDKTFLYFNPTED